MKYLLLASCLFWECPTADNLCTVKCRETFSTYENNNYEVFGVADKHDTMKNSLKCKCYSKKRGVM